MPISLIAPPHTPLDQQGKLRLAQVEAQAAHFSRSGVSGVFLCGSTGEGLSLSVGERKAIAEAWIDAATDFDLDVIVQVGATSLTDAIALAEHAGKVGARAISALAPCYFRPQTVGDLINFFAPVAAAAGDIPFFFYDIPQLTGVDLPTAEFLRQAPRKIPNLAGVKYTNGNLAQFQECQNVDGGRFEIFFGCDEALLAGYALGACGAVGSTYNFMAPLAHRIIAAFDAGDQELARQLQFKVVKTVNVLSEYGYLAAAKSLMSYYDIDCGPVRSPLRSIGSEQTAEIISRLTELGFPFESSHHDGKENGEVMRPHFAGARNTAHSSAKN